MGTTSRPGFFNAYSINYAGQLVDPGRTIRRMRTNLDMTQSELAKKAGLAPSFISRIELNKAGHTSQRTYARIAKAMGCTMDQMFGV